MSRERFHDLLEKYQEGRCTEAERAIVEQWYSLLDSDAPQQGEEELAMLEQKLWLRINGQITAEPQTRKFRLHRRPLIALLSVAASLCIGLLLLVLYNRNNQPLQPDFLTSSALKYKRVINGGSQQHLLRLEDGSQVLLEPKASLTYPLHFEKDLREVSLSGDGFFTISKNPSRPFLVYSKDVVTRVVGTSFTVKFNPFSKRSEVTVKTGKVIVTSAKYLRRTGLSKLFSEAEKVTLVPNQKTIFDPHTAAFSTTLADNPVLVSKAVAAENMPVFKYNDAPIGQVIGHLKKAYGIDILLLDADLNNNTFTGDLSTQNLYNKLDFLCESINASYQLVGTSIHVKKK